MSNPGVLALSLSLVSDSASYISSFNTVLPYLSLLGLIIFHIIIWHINNKSTQILFQLSLLLVLLWQILCFYY